MTAFDVRTPASAAEGRPRVRWSAVERAATRPVPSGTSLDVLTER